MARTYVILVNWNGWRDTIECLESLLRLDDPDFRVVVVDNGSTDGSGDALRRWALEPSGRTFGGPIWDMLPAERRTVPTFRALARDELGAARPDGATVTLVEAGANLGFAAANNLGMALAVKDPEAAFFWVLNNDTVVDPGSLSALVRHARARPDQGIVGAVLLYYRDPLMVQSLGGWCDPRRALAGHIGFGARRDALPPAAEVEARLDYVIGASMFVTREAYEATGGMSEDYFLYYEEIDWARRLPGGVGLGICLDAFVFHKEGGSIGTDSLDRPSDTSLYYSYVSALRFYGRHQRRHLPVAAGRIVYNLLGFARARDGAAFRVTVRALWDAAAGRRRRGKWDTAEFRRRA